MSFRYLMDDFGFLGNLDANNSLVLLLALPHRSVVKLDSGHTDFSILRIVQMTATMSLFLLGIFISIFSLSGTNSKVHSCHDNRGRTRSSKPMRLGQQFLPLSKAISRAGDGLCQLELARREDTTAEPPQRNAISSFSLPH
jgi:hypothetical protein